MTSRCLGPRTVNVGTHAWILVAHRVDAEPYGHQFVVHVPRAEVAVAGFLVSLFPGGNKGVKPHGYCAVYPFGFMYWTVQLVVVGIGSSPLSHPQKTTRN